MDFGLLIDVFLIGGYLLELWLLDRLIEYRQCHVDALVSCHSLSLIGYGLYTEATMV
jgi:hypothetical protein